MCEIHPSTDLIKVGKIIKAYGLNGQVKVIPYNQGGDVLIKARTWWIDHRNVIKRVSKLQKKAHNGSVIASWVECFSRDYAETLKGAIVRVARGDFPPLVEGEYYWNDLLGIQVYNLLGELLGIVNRLTDNGAHSIIHVVSSKQTNSIEYLIPFVDAYLMEIDLSSRRVTVDWSTDY